MRGRPVTAALPAIVRPVDADEDSAGMKDELLVDAVVANQLRSPWSCVWRFASPVGCVVALEGASGFAGRTESTSVLRCNVRWMAISSAWTRTSGDRSRHA
jgi:hypothetical protein